MTEGNVGGPAGLLAWLRLWSFSNKTTTVKVTMVSDDGPTTQGRVKVKSYEIPAFGQVLLAGNGNVLVTNPLTVSVHDGIWSGEAANFSTLIEFEEVGDAGLTTRPTEDMWNPGKVSNFGGKFICQ